MGLVRVLPRGPSELYILTSCYMHIHCFILELPVLCFRSPDDIATKQYRWVAPVLRKMLRRMTPDSDFEGSKRLCLFGQVIVTNAYLSHNFMSRQVSCLMFSYEIGSHRIGRGD